MGLPFIVSEEEFKELKEMAIGQRIRFYRQKLHQSYGDQYTSKNVALRIKVISPQAFSAIERGDTNDCPSRVLFAVSNDFNIDISAFSDEFYFKGYRHIPTKHSTGKTKRYRFGLLMYELNDNNELRIIKDEYTDRRISPSYIKLIMKSVFNIFALMGLKSYDVSTDLLAKQSYDGRSEYYSPWIARKDWYDHIDSITHKANENHDKMKE